MSKLIMTKGLPASGKSTWAKSMVGDGKQGIVRVNKDDLRSMMHNANWSGGNEKQILAVRNYVVLTVLKANQTVIVDDTNLAPVHESSLKQLAKDAGAEFEIKDFTHVPLDTCLKRDAAREAKVGKSVIMQMYNDFLKPKAVVNEWNPDLPSCVIVDMDGTLALHNGRSPFEFHRCGEDLLNIPVSQAVDALSITKGAAVIIVSGRDDSCEHETFGWLKANSVPYDMLLMRKTGDKRKDSIVKEEIYNKYIKDKFNVLAVFDDRPQVIRMWRSLGFFVFDCGEGIEF